MKKFNGVALGLLIFIAACNEENPQFSGGTTTTSAPRTPAPPPAGSLDSGNSGTPPAPAPVTEVVPPVPEKVVKKGSFSVFTIPVDPEPGKSYDIVITVDLSSADEISNYKQSDLTGSIMGTDGFMYGLGSNLDGIETFNFMPEKLQAVLKITIPGAIKNTKDTVKINSSLLEESQTIELVF